MIVKKVRSKLFRFMCWLMTLEMVIKHKLISPRVIKVAHEVIIQQYEPVFWDYMAGHMTKEQYLRWMNIFLDRKPAK